MHASALPILPAFQALLLGGAARRARPHVAPAVLRAKALSDLRTLFGWLIPNARWQSPPLGAPSRERLFTPRITFWAFLAQVLAADSAGRTTVRKVQAWWAPQGAGRCRPIPAPVAKRAPPWRHPPWKTSKINRRERLESNVPPEH